MALHGRHQRAADIAMAYKLIDAAEARWRAGNARTCSLGSVPARSSTRANSSSGHRHHSGRTGRQHRDRRIAGRLRNTPMHWY